MKKERYPQVHDTLARQKREPVPSQIYRGDFVDPDPDDSTALNIDFHELLKVQKEIESSLWYPQGILMRTIGRLEERGELSPVYERIISRIKNETHFFHEYEEVGLFDWIYRAFDGYKEANGRVHWEERPYGGGWYSLDSREIKVEDRSPDRVQILNWLVVGNLPHNLGVLVHEIIHSIQDSVKARIVRKALVALAGISLLLFLPDPLSRFRRAREYNLELVEAQAHRAPYGPPIDKSRVGIIRHIVDAKEEGKRTYLVDMDRLIYAVTAVDQLDALGFTIAEVADLISWPGIWNKKQGNYPRIQRLIDKKSRELALDENDLENLVLAHGIERNIDRLRARHIAQEELRNIQLWEA